MYCIFEKDCECRNCRGSVTIEEADDSNEMIFGGGVCLCPCHSLSDDEKEKFILSKSKPYDFPPNCL
jgi:hypothetical protein